MQRLTGWVTTPIHQTDVPALRAPRPRQRHVLFARPRARSRTARRSGALKSSSGVDQDAHATKGLLNANKLQVGVAYALLNGVALTWGSQHAVIKWLLDSVASDDPTAQLMSPALLNTLRFALSAVVTVPALGSLWTSHRSPDLNTDTVTSEHMSTSEQTWQAPVTLLRDGCELGAWMFAGYALQSAGLQYTDASRSAFLLYLNVKLVPVCGMLLYARRYPWQTWASAALAVLGTMLLATSTISGQGSSANAIPIFGSFNLGDALSIAAAGASAMFILRLEAFARRHPAGPLNAVSLCFVTALSFVWLMLNGDFASPADLLYAPLGLSPLQAFALLYLGVVATAFTNWAQARGQRVIPADKAALVYAMDPVYAAVFAQLILHESLTVQGFAGGAIITCAALWGRSSRDQDETEKGK
ncbi:putative transporter [Porphyridium purpureum]|uniref:Putative transporter n=1 Tax=Porphyridium purpureum TaxID=35688 RepID=A0A5J4Z7J5_PORPP|nr:putative transporter [Porphyridium purpureum]|eukprot:POR6495..scf295_1